MWPWEEVEEDNEMAALGTRDQFAESAGSTVRGTMLGASLMATVGSGVSEMAQGAE